MLKNGFLNVAYTYHKILGNKMEQSTDTYYIQHGKPKEHCSMKEVGHGAHMLQDSIYRKCPGRVIHRDRKQITVCLGLQDGGLGREGGK